MQASFQDGCFGVGPSPGPPVQHQQHQQPQLQHQHQHQQLQYQRQQPPQQQQEYAQLPPTRPVSFVPPSQFGSAVSSPFRQNGLAGSFGMINNPATADVPSAQFGFGIQTGSHRHSMPVFPPAGMAGFGSMGSIGDFIGSKPVPVPSQMGSMMTHGLDVSQPDSQAGFVYSDLDFGNLAAMAASGQLDDPFLPPFSPTGLNSQTRMHTPPPTRGATVPSTQSGNMSITGLGLKPGRADGSDQDMARTSSVASASSINSTGTVRRKHLEEESEGWQPFGIDLPDRTAAGRDENESVGSSSSSAHGVLAGLPTPEQDAVIPLAMPVSFQPIAGSFGGGGPADSGVGLNGTFSDFGLGLDFQMPMEMDLDLSGDLSAEMTISPWNMSSNIDLLSCLDSQSGVGHSVLNPHDPASQVGGLGMLPHVGMAGTAGMFDPFVDATGCVSEPSGQVAGTGWQKEPEAPNPAESSVHTTPTARLDRQGRAPPVLRSIDSVGANSRSRSRPRPLAPIAETPRTRRQNRLVRLVVDENGRAGVDDVIVRSRGRGHRTTTEDVSVSDSEASESSSDQSEDDDTDEPLLSSPWTDSRPGTSRTSRLKDMFRSSRASNWLNRGLLGRQPTTGPNCQTPTTSSPQPRRLTFTQSTAQAGPRTPGRTSFSSNPITPSRANSGRRQNTSRSVPRRSRDDRPMELDTDDALLALRQVRMRNRLVQDQREREASGRVFGKQGRIDAVATPCRARWPGPHHPMGGQRGAPGQSAAQNPSQNQSLGVPAYTQAPPPQQQHHQRQHHQQHQHQHQQHQQQHPAQTAMEVPGAQGPPAEVVMLPVMCRCGRVSTLPSEPVMDCRGCGRLMHAECCRRIGGEGYGCPFCEQWAV